MAVLKYFIVDNEDICKVDWSKVIQNSSDECRWNISRSQFVLKGFDVPVWYIDKPIYNIEKIQRLLVNGDW